jgi:hypothetical protein
MVKRSGRQADHPSPSSAKLCGAISPFPHTLSHRAQGQHYAKANSSSLLDWTFIHKQTRIYFLRNIYFSEMRTSHGRENADLSSGT